MSKTENELIKEVEGKNVTKPIFLFVDGHKSHLNMRLSDERGKICHLLPLNATYNIQVANVSVFKSLKSEWKNTVREWVTRT